MKMFIKNIVVFALSIPTLLLMFGVLFLNSNARQDGYEKGLEDAFNIVEELNKSYSKGKEDQNE